MPFLNFLMNAAFWLVVSTITMSFVEFFAHSQIMHRKFFLAKWIKAIEKVFVHHAVKHHHIYSQNFEDEPLPHGEDRHIRLSMKEGIVESLPVSFIFGFFFWWPAALIFTGTVCMHAVVWNAIHLEMHKPIGRFFANWPAYKFLRDYHCAHHKYPNKNFNVVLPFADYIMGTAVNKLQRDAAVAQMLLPNGKLAESPLEAQEREVALR